MIQAVPGTILRRSGCEAPRARSLSITSGRCDLPSSARRSHITAAARGAFSLALLLALLFLASPLVVASTKENPKRDAHIVLIRGLSSEVAVAKLPFPRGKHGVF